MKLRKASIVQLTHHLTCVSHIDQYSQFLMKQLGENQSCYLTIRGYPFSILCSLVQKKGHIELQTKQVELPEVPSITLPSYFPRLFKKKEKTSIEQLFYSSQISFSGSEKFLSLLLILLEQSIRYRSFFMIQATSKKLSLLSFIHYWLYYLKISIGGNRA